MKLWFYLGIILLLPSCAWQRYSTLYEIKMMSGDVLYARSKPKADESGFYRFDDVNKQRYIVQKNLILYIKPTDFAR